MKILIKNTFFYIRCIRFIPLLLFITFLSKKKKFLIEERNVWIKIIKNEEVYSWYNFLWLLDRLPEYRSILYYRLGSFVGNTLNVLAKKRVNLKFDTPSKKIGVGLVIQHGFSTIVNAEKIGENCQIWQNVTIGTNRLHSNNIPIIGSDVKISAGAIVLGDITIGDNVTIGAGAVVTKNVPNNTIVVGNPASIIMQEGKRVKKLL